MLGGIFDPLHGLHGLRRRRTYGNLEVRAICCFSLFWFAAITASWSSKNHDLNDFLLEAPRGRGPQTSAKIANYLIDSKTFLSKF